MNFALFSISIFHNPNTIFVMIGAQTEWKKKRSATTTWFWSNKCLTWCSFVYHIFVMIKNNLSTKTPSGDNRLFCVKTNLGILFAVFHSLNIYCTPKGAKQTNRMNYSPSWYCAQNMVYKTVRCCFSFFFCFSLKTSGRMEKKDNKFASAG